jgi:hypothetical protein
MKRLKLLGLALIAVFALSAAVTAVASAELVSFLPTGSAASPVTFTAKSGAGKLETLGGGKIECASDKGTGEVTSSDAGHFVVEFEGCKNPTLGVSCADLSHTDAQGVIKVEGAFDLRMGLSGQPLGIIAFLVNPDVHFLCSIVLFTVLGCAAGEITASQLNTLTNKVEVLLKQKAGENEILSIDNLAETAMEECTLLTKQGTGTEETSGEETHEELTGFKQNGAAVTMLIHA